MLFMPKREAVSTEPNEALIPADLCLVLLDSHLAGSGVHAISPILGCIRGLLSSQVCRSKSMGGGTLLVL